MQNRYKILKTIIILIILFCITGCTKKTDTDDKTKVLNDTSTIDDVDGICFTLPTYVSTKATAITQISDDMDYDTNVIYSYKNGKDTYILFCMDELIVIAVKGTSFSFSSATNKEEALSKSNLLNTWFSKSEKKFNYKEKSSESSYKIIADVTAEVVITSQLYGDYSGKLAVIESEDTEWSLFVGAVAPTVDKLSKQQDSLLTTIIDSFSLYEKPVKAASYDVVINQNLKKTEIEQDETESIIEENPAVESEQKEITPLLSEKSNEPEQQLTSAESKVGLNLSNQQRREVESNKAYTSNQYSMLSLGQSGLFTTRYMKESEQLIIRPIKVYTGDDAISLIKSYAKSQNRYQYFDAPDGYSWQLVEYDVSYEKTSIRPYVNIRIMGVDGEPLVFRGVTIVARTHDANFQSYEEGQCSYKNYCYYAVPNGCHEYSLVIGDNENKQDMSQNAYYYINH